MPKENLSDAVIVQVVRLLRSERQRQKISMNALAQRAGLSQAMISLVERDLRSPTLDTLLRIAGVLKVDLGKIISRAKRMTEK